jgi:hypothetical protein
MSVGSIAVGLFGFCEELFTQAPIVYTLNFSGITSMFRIISMFAIFNFKTIIGL